MSKIDGLMAYLLLEGKESYPRPQLAALLWPELSERKGRENLRQALYQLRRALRDVDDAPFTITRTAVQVDPVRAWVDARAFQTYIAAEAWTAAADLYTGEFMADFTADDSVPLHEWILVMRERLHQMAVHAFTRLARTAAAEQDAPTAERYARRLLELEPWSEPAHRILMRQMARTGRRNEALKQYEACVRILADELGVPPTAETDALYRQIKNERRQTAVSTLPADVTPLVAREDELADLRERLTDPACRLLTIVGPGGVGKTRLLLGLGRTMQQTAVFPAGVTFVSLVDLEAADTSAETEDRIAARVLDKLGRPQSENGADSAVQTLIHAIRNDRRLLLLDNWEHLPDGAALPTRLLAAAPQLKIAATSRLPLQLSGEWLFPLAGLAVSDPAHATAGAPSGAMRLFVQAARRVRADFRLTADNAVCVARICRALEGHPLAIEMAAAWLRGLTLDEVADGILDGLDLLETDARDVADRHREIRRVFAHSWQQLTPTQQQAAAALSLFRTPFSPAAAHAVGHASRMASAGLVVRSWLRRTADGRYQYHELLRRFAGEKLREDAAVAAEARSRYITYHLKTVLADHEDELEHSRELPYLDHLRRRWADVVQAWRWAVADDDVAVLGTAVAAFLSFYQRVGWLRDGIDLLETAGRRLRTHLPVDAAPQRKRTVARLLIGAAHLRNVLVVCEPVPTMMAAAEALAVELGDERLRLDARLERAVALMRLGRMKESTSLATRLATTAERLGAERTTAAVHGLLAGLADEQNRSAEAEHHGRIALETYQRLGLPIQAAGVRHNLAVTLIHLGRYTAARRLFQRNLLANRRSRAQQEMAVTLEGLGVVALHQHRLHTAALHLQGALRRYEAIDDADGVAYTYLYLGHVALARGETATAGDRYRRMIRVRREMGYHHLVPQGWAGLAAVALARDRPAEAMTYVERIWPILRADELQGEDTARIYHICYRVLAAADDDRAPQVPAHIVPHLYAQADLLPNAAAREAFLCGVAAHRALLAADAP